MTIKEPQLVAIDHIFKALRLASWNHREQTRKSDGTPYINHLIETADLLVNIGQTINEDVIVAAILHDILEDTELTISSLLGEYNPYTIYILLMLTEDKSCTLEERRQDTLRKVRNADDDEIKKIKLADLCSNVAYPPKGWSEKQLSEYFSYTDQLALMCKDASYSLFSEYSLRRRYKNSDD